MNNDFPRAHKTQKAQDGAMTHQIHESQTFFFRLPPDADFRHRTQMAGIFREIKKTPKFILQQKETILRGILCNLSFIVVLTARALSSYQQL